MDRREMRREGLLGINLAFFVLGVSGVQSQIVAVPQPLPVKVQDENGVDVVSGYANFEVNDVSIGTISNRTRSVQNINSNSFQFDWAFNSGFARFGLRTYYHGTVTQINPQYHNNQDSRPRVVVSVAEFQELFLKNPDGTYESANGGQLIDNSCVVGQSGTRLYTDKFGNEVEFDCDMTSGAFGTATKIKYANDIVIDINYNVGPYGPRIQSVTSSNGLMLKYVYAADKDTASSAYRDLISIIGINRTYEACDPLADVCTQSWSWPKSSYAWTGNDLILSVVDQSGRVTRFTMDGHRRVIAVKPPSSATDKIFYEYCNRVAPFDCHSQVATQSGGGPPVLGSLPIVDRVKSVVVDGQAWTYSFPEGTYGYYYLPYRSDGPEGRRSFAMSTIIGAGALLTYDRNGPNGVTANFQNTPFNRLISAKVYLKPPEVYTYDERGNVTSNGIVSAGYDAACINPKTCNRPNWVRDANGGQTDFTYDPAHGGILTATGPLVGGVRPQTRYEYVQRYARFLDANGALVSSAAPIWLLSATSLCRTSAATGNPASPCILAGDEVRTTYEYGPDSGVNNLVQRGTVTSADGQSIRTCLGYDHRLQQISQTQPAGAPAPCP